MSGSEPEPPGERDQIIFTAHVLVLVFDTKSFKVSLEETRLQERGMEGGVICVHHPFNIMFVNFLHSLSDKATR